MVMEHKLRPGLINKLDHRADRAEPDFHTVKIFLLELFRGQETICYRHIAKIKKFREVSITDTAFLCHLDLFLNQNTTIIIPILGVWYIYGGYTPIKIPVCWTPDTWGLWSVPLVSHCNE